MKGSAMLNELQSVQPVQPVHSSATQTGGTGGSTQQTCKLAPNPEIGGQCGAGCQHGRPQGTARDRQPGSARVKEKHGEMHGDEQSQLMSRQQLAQ